MCYIYLTTSIQEVKHAVLTTTKKEPGRILDHFLLICENPNCCPSYLYFEHTHKKRISDGFQKCTNRAVQKAILIICSTEVKHRQNMEIPFCDCRPQKHVNWSLM